MRKKSFWLVLGVLSLLIFLALVFFFYDSSSGRLEVHFINVGYGDSIFIKLPNSSTILVDSGEKKYSKKIYSYLKEINIDSIDTAIITHPHDNHFGGFDYLLDKFSFKRLFTNGSKQGEKGYSELIELFDNKGIPVRVLKAGSELFQWPQKVKIRVLSPEELTSSDNDNAIALWIAYRHMYILLTSDIGKDQQDELLKRHAFLKKANCVQIPHHGKDMSEKFINTFKNVFFIASTGKSKWGLPDPTELEKLEGILMRTDREGTIVIKTDGNNLEVITKKDW